jgi:SAM-dependent methyltransferase
MFLSTWRQILGGKTLMRACMNNALAAYTLTPGIVLDIGGGKNPSYFKYLKGVTATNVINIDKQHGEGARKDVDFETDRLPFDDSSLDEVLILNVLEHVYHHMHLAREMHRVLKEGKRVIGFVPFLINYHPDPRDYFRYTDEALETIFKEAGFAKVEVKPLGYGPFSVNFNNLASFMPWYLNAFAWPFTYAADRLLLAFKPSFKKRFPLGYLFILTK